MISPKYGIRSKEDLAFLLQAIASDLETTANEALERNPGETEAIDSFQWLAYLLNIFINTELS